MRYIRTKEGRIFDINEIHIPYQIIGNLLDFNSQGRFEILKQADTIEELCDGFVVEYNNSDHTIFKHFCDLERHYDLYNQEYHHVNGRYGCIWVFKKGLIYVAEMNDKGDLELL